MRSSPTKRLWPCVLAAVLAATLPLAASGQEAKGPSERDCRNLNFPSSDSRLIRACQVRFDLCAAPPPAWTRSTQAMQVCREIGRERQLQRSTGAAGNAGVVAPARSADGVRTPPSLPLPSRPGGGAAPPPR